MVDFGSECVKKESRKTRGHLQAGPKGNEALCDPVNHLHEIEHMIQVPFCLQQWNNE
jgi:hypothetical protein